MSSSRPIVPFSSDLDGGLEIFLGDAVGGFDAIKLGTRHGSLREHLGDAIQFGSGIRQPGLGRPHLRFAPQPLLGSFARLNRRQGRASLIELALQRREPSLEFILSELRDHFAFGDLLSFLDRQLDQQTRNLKCQLNSPRRFDRSRKRPDMRVVAGRHDHRLDRANQLGSRRSRLRAAANKAGHQRGRSTRLLAGQCARIDSLP